MATDFAREYALRSEEELLEIASDRESLTDEAKSALDAEMRTRHLTPAEVHKHERLVERGRRREARRTKRKLGWKIENLVDAFWMLVAVAALTAVYLSLPSRYHLAPDWEEAASFVMFGTVTVGTAGTSLWRKSRFWLALLVSSAAHVLLLHGWIMRFGSIKGKGREEIAILLGPLLFAAVFGIAYQVRRRFGAEAASEQRGHTEVGSP